MSRLTYKKFNNYNYTDEYIDIVKEYLTSGELPASFSNYQRTHFKLQYRNFILRNGKVVYEPLNLIIVPESEKGNILKDLYNDFNIGVGVGIKSFYDKVNSRYLGIKRVDVSEFLKGQQYYQLTKPQPKAVNRPIIGEYPNHRWAIDLIDMKDYIGFNSQFRYILTGIDYFSKYVFAIKLKENKALQTVRALDTICEKLETYPEILQSDNGAEFKNKAMKEWATANDVRLVNTTSYTPQANGLIENFNGILRKMIREGFIRNNNLDWIHYLDDYIENRNNTKHSTTKHTPAQVWEPGRKRIDKLDDDEKEYIRSEDPIPHNRNDILNKVTVNLEHKAKKMLERFEVDKFEEGDKVRVLLSSINSKVRALVKSGRGKLVVVKYTPTIFYIDKVIKPQGNFKDYTRERYQLRYANGRPLTREFKGNRPNDIYESQYFFGSELQRIDPETNDEEPVLTNERANYLNRAVTVEDEIAKKEEARKRVASKPKPEKKAVEVVDRTALKRNKTKYNVADHLDDLI